MSEAFSATIIARNEAKAIPKLLESLRGVPEILVVDTGSTDGTQDVARSAGARVVEAGDRFLETPGQTDIELFEKRYGHLPTFTTQSRLFNYGAARNHAMDQASHDWCFHPDADEIVAWNLPAVQELLPGADKLRYQFAFSHQPDGSPWLQFAQAKFFRKSVFRWKGKVHEIESVIPGKEPRILYTDAMRVDHWQQTNENRSNYLPKLEWAVLEYPDYDRNHYYLGREYYYAWEFDKAISMLTRYLDMSHWAPERSQASIFIGDSFKLSGRGPEAVAWYHKALQEDTSRREPLFALGNTYYEWAQYRAAAVYLRAATEIPLNPEYYLNDMDLYTWRVWDLLAMVYDKLGETGKAREAWLEAVKAAPNDQRIINNARWFYRREA